MIRRMLFSALATLAGLALLEVVLVLLDHPRDPLYEGDPGHFWQLRPDLDIEVEHKEESWVFSVQTSAEGLRDEGIPGSPWILALGDSTTFGWGVEAEETWPEQLEDRLSMPVVNAGVPGHSTHQGLQFSPPLLARGPELVLFSWLLRDAELASRPDRGAQPAAFPRNTRLYALLKGLMPVRPVNASMPRVSPEDFAANLQTLAAVAGQHQVDAVVLAFPMVNPPMEHLGVLGDVGLGVLSPELPREAFFEFDPLHLNAEGHQLLAAALEGPIRQRLAAE